MIPLKTTTAPVPARPSWTEIATLLRGEVEPISRWSADGDLRRLALQAGVIVVGAGCYGAAMGWWRAPEQAMFTAIKFPLIMLLTCAGNAQINGMLAPLLGLNVPFRQSFTAVFMSLTIAAAILGAFSPLIAFLTWNAPPMSPQAVAGPGYSLVKLTHVLVIAFAGTTGNVRLLQLLQRLSGNRAVALRVLAAWLAGNLLLGSQLCWILRPFIGSPVLPVEFVRATALHGNFYENVIHSVLQIFND
jgi:hypothetical protein